MNGKLLTFAPDMETGDDLHALQLAGVRQLATAVASTLGPSGRNVCIERAGEIPIVTKDGVTVAKHIQLPDGVQMTAVKTLQSAAEDVVQQTGDGTTTTIVLAHRIFESGIHELAKPHPSEVPLGQGKGSPAPEGHVDVVDGPAYFKMPKRQIGAIALNRSVQAAAGAVCEAIRHSATQVTTDAEILAVATIAMNGDAHMAELILEAHQAVGKDGVITMGESRDAETHLEVRDGFRFNQGFSHPGFITDQARKTVILDNPLIFVTERLLSQSLNADHAIVTLLQHAATLNRPLLIIADDIVGDALTIIVGNHRDPRVTLTACCVKAPSVGNDRKNVLGDIAIATGAKVLTSSGGKIISKVGYSAEQQASFKTRGWAKLRIETIEGQLGQCARAVITASETILEGCQGPLIESVWEPAPDNAEVRAFADSLLTQSAESAHQHPRYAEELRHRAARLMGRVAVLHVGASSEAAARPLRDAVEDAVHAVRAAAEEGVVAGGGAALFFQGLMLGAASEHPSWTSDQRIGMRLVAACCQAPLRQIARNAGEDPVEIAHEMLATIRQCMGEGENEENVKLALRRGWNAAENQFGDMFDSGIIDPAKVVRVALEKAASVAGLLLTTSCAITFLPPSTPIQQITLPPNPAPRNG